MNIAAASLNRLFTLTLGKFLTVGVLNTALTMVVIFVSKAWFGLADVPANALGYVIGMVCSFVLNKTWTFSHRGDTVQAAIRFVLVAGVAYLVNLLVLQLLLGLGLNPYACHIVAMPFYTLVFYLGSKAIVFAQFNRDKAGEVSSPILPQEAGQGRGLEGVSGAAQRMSPRDLFLFAMAIGVSALVFFYRITDATLEVWDEARLANNALEMSRTGLSLITTYDWVPDHWNTKPPLLIWLMALSMKLFGLNEFSVRLPSVLASIATVALVYWFVNSQLRRPVHAFFAVIILLASPGYVLVHGARSGNYDALLTLLTTAYVLAAFVFLEGDARSRKSWFAVTMIAIVLAFYTKTIQGFIFMPAIFLYALFARRLVPVLRAPYFYVGCILAAGACIAYYWFRNEIDPGYFAAVQANDLGGRYANALEGHHGGPLWYVMRIKYFPWLIPSFCMAAYLLFRRSTELKRLIAFLTTCSLFYLFVISSASTKLAWYAMPLVPLYAIICALGIGELVGKFNVRALATRNAPLLLLCVAVSAAVFTANAALIHRSIAKKERNPYDQHSFALRSLVNTDREIGSLVVVHPGYPVAPGFPYYVAPTLFYAHALTVSGIPTTITQHAPAPAKDVTLLTCEKQAAAEAGMVRIPLASGKNCALLVPGPQAAVAAGN
ncbi:GtrA family protein [Massilia sp. METH4]|uniref:GtrA family protein n=1 Tax=Massilia sp. METH4 TaxID=3123041 RepID=UPI0030CC1112